MGKTLCLVSGVEDAILNGVIKHLLHDNGIKAHEYSGSFGDSINVVNNDISHVIVGNKLLPVEYREMFERNDNPVVIELLDNGKNLGLYMGDISETMLNSIIGLKSGNS